MGSKVSKPTKTASSSSSAPTPPETSSYHHWPDNLYLETRDMADASFLIYTFGRILDVARKQGLKGITISPTGQVVDDMNTKKNQNNDSKESKEDDDDDEGIEVSPKGQVVHYHHKNKVYTPEEIGKIISDNAEVLAEEFPKEFADPALLQKTLRRLQNRAVTAGAIMSGGNAENYNNNTSPLTLQHYDDKHQHRELVFAVTKDDVNKRITLGFRGTENELAFGTNWKTNLHFTKTWAPFPAALRGKVVDSKGRNLDGAWLHSGFFNYIFKKTFEDSDDPSKRKFHDIIEDVKPLLKDNPTYKLYVTGHSLGAALATIVSYCLACDAEIPKPVTCLVFASPRVGDSNFLKATRYLEKEGLLRMCRVVNDNDLIATVPMYQYCHVGFQVRLYEKAKKPLVVSYPKVADTYYNRWKRAFWNSPVPNLNLTYDHSEYRERVGQNEDGLKKINLNELYASPDLTGYSTTFS